MNLIRKFRLIIAIVLPLLILLSIRTCSTGIFKYDAKKWAEPSFSSSNIVGISEIGKLPGEKLIIYLDKNIDKIIEKHTEEVDIRPDSIMSRKYLHKIKDLKEKQIIQRIKKRMKK